MAPIQFGVLCIPFQILDVIGPVDVLTSSTISAIKNVEVFRGETIEFTNRGVDIEFHYIGDTMDGIVGTGNCTIRPTTTCATCPKLDYLLIGGPDAEFFLNVPPVFANFIRERVEEVKGVFTTCTGALVTATVGVLDGNKATVNHQCLSAARKLKPEVTWLDDQWVMDGKFWTAGGACAGMDMMAHWLKENYGQDVAEFGWSLLDFEPRDVHGNLVPRKMGLRVKN